VRYLDKKISKLKAIKDESYTSKTYSCNGFVDDKLKSTKVIKFQNMLIDRDIDGARGILIKQLSKVA
jgi:transposase